ncbi:MAG: ZIP family metal transporter [Clostridia bacterium]|nr:ZIP family metal transporter [Clostridia bacterium]
MWLNIFAGLMIPFAGTALGAACVFFMKKELGRNLQRMLTGFASGVMVAASIWSLILPAMELSAEKGKLSFLPPVIGFWLGILFLLLLDSVIPHLHLYAEKAEGVRSKAAKTTMMLLAVTLHNIPEGMAVGVIYAGLLSGGGKITAGGALSGAVEPLGALLTVLASGLIVPAMPYFLSFAAGAMLYVVVEELIPEMSQGEHSNTGVVMFALGFTVMMALDVALG